MDLREAAKRRFGEAAAAVGAVPARLDRRLVAAKPTSTRR